MLKLLLFRVCCTSVPEPLAYPETLADEPVAVQVNDGPATCEAMVTFVTAIGQMACVGGVK